MFIPCRASQYLNFMNMISLFSCSVLKSGAKIQQIFKPANFSDKIL